MTRDMPRLDAYWILPPGEKPDGGNGMEVNGLQEGANGDPGDAREHAMTDLKDQVQRHEYKVDSQRVAEEMIRRMRFARWARTTLLSDAGGGPGSAAPAH